MRDGTTTDTNDTTDTTVITWEPPAGGHWQLETVHTRGGQPRIFQERATPAFKAGFQTMAERYGLPIDYLDARFVNDHCYGRMKPLGAPEPKMGKESKAPPPFVLKVLSRVHPALRARAGTARRALADRLWRADTQRWYDQQRAEFLERNRGLQAEPIEIYDDEALIRHIGEVADQFSAGIRVHFELTPAHNIGVGRFVLACQGWGIATPEALALLTGSSPASKAAATALSAIARACDAAGVKPESLDDVRQASPEAAAALDEYLADNAWRIVTQYTPRGLALIELPGAIVQAIRSADRDPKTAPLPDPSTLRARVPAADRARFDELLHDARLSYGVRDDNVAYTMVWPSGLVRRALLEAGRRLVDLGLIERPELALWLGEAELAAALRGDASVAAEAGRRDARIAACEAAGAPMSLGPSEGPPPDPSVFPAAMAELTRALMAVLLLEMPAFDLGGGTDASWTSAGIGVGTGRYVGRACVASSPEEALERLEPGDVLVTTLTTPAYDSVMAIAGAVVTEEGGLMSHTALVAREYGIPAVVGVKGATGSIADGSLVEVDAAAGRVAPG